MEQFKWTLDAADRSTRGRTGRFRTPHGEVETPAFMPVGTAGSVKGLLPGLVRDTGTQVILANTYHLALRPGAEVVADLGGLHAFCGWDRTILTDSGGYQVFSLAELNRVDDEGVTFRSHVDGAPMRLDPESATRIQNLLGADIIMAFDQCPPSTAAPEVVQAATERSIRWAARCRASHQRSDQALFGIVQGGLDTELRHRCAEALVAMDFPGYAVGGLAVGESDEARDAVLAAVTPALPSDRPRYLMGVGRPIDILRAVARGIDLFDCVMPTRNGRNSYAFTSRGTVRLRNEKYKRSREPLDPECDCPACRNFSLGYLRHLFLAGEMLGPILASLHNIAYYQRWMQRIRRSIGEGTLGDWLAREMAAPAANAGDADEDGS